MKKHTLLILILLSTFMFGQNDYKARLPISGGFTEIGISPSEKIWIATKAGNVYKSDNIDSL